MNEHDDAYVDAMLMVNMQANTMSVTNIKLCRPLGACHAVKIKTHLHVHSYMLLLLRKYASTYIHSLPSPDSPKIILLLVRERIAKNIFLSLLFPMK